MRADPYGWGYGTSLFKQAEISAIWQRYLAGKVSWMRIWHLFVVDDWCRRNRVVSGS